jgi:hypothetical protein
MGAVVHQPHVAFGVIRVDENTVRPNEQLVVLLPRLDQLPVPIHDVDDVIPTRMARRILLRHVEARRVPLRND